MFPSKMNLGGVILSPIPEILLKIFLPCYVFFLMQSDSGHSAHIHSDNIYKNN